MRNLLTFSFLICAFLFANDSNAQLDKPACEKIFASFDLSQYDEIVVYNSEGTSLADRGLLEMDAKGAAMEFEQSHLKLAGLKGELCFIAYEDISVVIGKPGKGAAISRITIYTSR